MKCTLFDRRIAQARSPAVMRGEFRFLQCVVSVIVLWSCGESTAPPVPAALVAVTATSQTAVVGSAVTAAPSVRVVDKDGNGVANVAVTFAIVSGGGTIGGENQTTDATGIATVGTWTLGTSAGANALSASATGLTPTQFTATGTPDVPASIAVTPAQLSLRKWGDMAQVTVSMSDRFGNTISSPPAPAFAVADAMIAAVSTAGLITSRAPGNTTLSVQVGALTESRPVVVKLKDNDACVLPAVPGERAVAANPVFEEVFTLPDSARHWNSNYAAPLDVDGDGKLDIVMFRFSEANAPPGDVTGKVQAWRNLGSSTFADATTQLLGGSAIPIDGTTTISIADLNNDGRLDIFASAHGLDAPPFPGAFNLMLVVQPGGTIANVAPTALHPYRKAFTNSATVADIDCDGDHDIYEGDPGSPLPQLQVNAGGVFTANTTLLPAEAIASPAESFIASEFCDVDSDGDPDLLLGAFRDAFGPNRTERLLINDGFGKFTAKERAALPAPHFTNNQVTRILCVDHDRDGWQDLIVLNLSDMGAVYLSLWRNNRNQTFTDITTAAQPQTWRSPLGLARAELADLNGDGWTDFVVSGQGNESLFVNKGGTFQQVTAILPAGSNADFAWIIPFDADNDGRQDLVIARNSFGAITIARNTAP